MIIDLVDTSHGSKEYSVSLYFPTVGIFPDVAPSFSKKIKVKKSLIYSKIYRLAGELSDFLFFGTTLAP